jgi:hypothetical protein
MKCAFVTIPFRGLMFVNRTNPKSVTYVSGTFVTLDSGLYKGERGGFFDRGNEANRTAKREAISFRMDPRYQPAGMTTGMLSA